MSEHSGRPPGKPPAHDTQAHDSHKSGRIARDAHGNVTWSWADDDDLRADDTAGASRRLKALVDPQLSVVEDPVPTTSIPSNPQGLHSGYDPYDSGALLKQNWKKKKDLRELSKWIELRKKATGQDEGS